MKTAFWTAAFFALALSACGAPKQNAAAPAGATASASDCNRAAHEVVPFSAADAQDIVEARSIGDDCRTAFVLITVRKATGEPLWAWATPHNWLHGSDDSGAVTPAEMDEFLKGWVKIHVDTTASLPDWPERAVAFKDDLGPYMHTPLQRDQYVEVRGKSLPRLCHATGLESGLCIYYDTATGLASEIFQSGV